VRLVANPSRSETGPVKVTKLRIDGQFFYLDHEQDIPALKAEILDSVIKGPRFIDFTAIGHGAVSVLMMPSLGARFEIQERAEEEVADWDDYPPVIDYEMYGLA
jgi:hypothetical protein